MLLIALKLISIVIYILQVLILNYYLATINLMHEYMKENGYELDISDEKYHHEIYLSDPRKCDVNKLKNLIKNY